MPTSADVSMAESVGKEPAADKFPHAARWFRHLASFDAKARKAFAKAKGGAAAAPAKDDDEEDVDLVSLGVPASSF